MRGILATGPGEVELRNDLPDPAAGPEDVIVAVEACGICGGDVEDFLDPANAPSNLPVIPGHEGWGRVVDTGADVPSALLDAPVAIDPLLPCGKCAACRRGSTNICPHRGAIGVTEPGAWAEFVRAPAGNVHVIEDERLAGRLPVLIEPVACALYGVQRLCCQPGQGALVFGAGPMGLLLALLLGDAGVAPVTIVEPNAARRERARELIGADCVELEELGDRGAELVVDASGNPLAIEAALARVQPSGTLLLFGLAPRNASVSVRPYELLKRDVTIVTAFGIRGTFGAAVQATARLAPQLGNLVTHEFGLGDHAEAFATLRSGAGVKVALRPERTDR